MSGTAHRLGLTGGIGSGKSTVTKLLADLGACTIDADAVSKTVTGPGGAAIAAIATNFGPKLLTKDGALDREQMRTLVYSNPAAKKLLESVIHPLVGQTIALQARDAEQAGARCIVFDIPLLVESAQWRQSLHRVIVVDCSAETQIARVMARNSLDADSVKKIMITQAPRARRLAAADWVVFNDGITLEHLAQHVRQIGSQFGL